MTLHARPIFVTLATCSFERTLSFYSQLFGQSPHVHIPDVYGEFQLNGLRLGIFKPNADHKAEFAGSSGSMSLCIEVERLEMAIAHLTNLGYPPAGNIMNTSHGRELYAYDPDGNRLILHEGIE